MNTAWPKYAKKYKKIGKIMWKKYLLWKIN